MRRLGLRPGDYIEGTARKPKDNERYWALVTVNKVNGKAPADLHKRIKFHNLTPIYPIQKIVLEMGSMPLSNRVIDLVAPIGRGQRGMIVAPPKAGKTTIMKAILRPLFTLVLGATVAYAANAQAFEGTIEFTKTTGPVVTNYKYYVKGDHVRIEEINSRGEVQGIMLVDTKDRTVYALSPERKLYMDVPNMRLPKDVKTEVKKTGEMKDIAGYKCEKWVVKSATEDRTITYWVAADEFTFFVPLLETLNRKDEQAVFFLEIDGAAGVFLSLIHI